MPVRVSVLLAFATLRCGAQVNNVERTFGCARADVEATAKAYLQTRGFKVDDGYSGLAVGAKGLDAIRRKPG